MSDYELVYEPSDDTFLLMDALQYEFDYDNADAKLKLQRASLIRITLEMGCGSGVGSICLAKLLMEQRERTDEITEKYNVNHYVTDINENAIRTTLETATRNGLCDSAVNAYKCDLATPLLDELQDSVDVLLFNPPYVPTPDVDVKGSSIETSWAGGTDGRLVLDRALPQIAHLLSWPHGVAYIITVDENKPEEISELMAKSYGIKVIPLVRRKARNEFLSVLKMSLTRNLNNNNE